MAKAFTWVKKQGQQLIFKKKGSFFWGSDKNRLESFRRIKEAIGLRSKINAA
jgi:hypothetical protein